MSNFVVIRKSGGFYNVFDNDAFIISYLAGYKITGGRCGFPLNSLNKIVNLLGDNYVNYIVKENMEEVDKKDYKKNNKYDKILNKGKKKFDIDYRINSIIDKLNNFSYDELEKLLNKLEEYLDE